MGETLSLIRAAFMQQHVSVTPKVVRLFQSNLIVCSSIEPDRVALLLPAAFSYLKKSTFLGPLPTNVYFPLTFLPFSVAFSIFDSRTTRY
jgi:hypothetical protein